MSSTQSEPAGARPARPWPAEQLEHWPIERLLPYANNARLHSEADLDKIAASISNWGWTVPVLADEDGVLIAGHLRVAVAAKLKLTSIPVVVARGWSEEEKNGYRLADNELAARASWDPDLLRDELRKLEFAGFNLDLIGFEADPRDLLLPHLHLRRRIDLVRRRLRRPIPPRGGLCRQDPQGLSSRRSAGPAAP